MGDVVEEERKGENICFMFNGSGEIPGISLFTTVKKNKLECCVEHN